MKIISKTLKLLTLALSTTVLTMPAMATPVYKIVQIVDAAGNGVSGATISIGGTVLTGAGATNTVSGTNPINGAAVTGASLKYYDLADTIGSYSFVYDPAVIGEAHFVITASKTGVTISSPTISLDTYADTSNLIAVKTLTTLALPSAAPGGAGGLPTADAAGKVAFNNTSIGSVTGAVGSVTGAVGSVTAPVVASSVTGAVGSVTGAVGSVSGAVGSVTGSVGSVVAPVSLPPTAPASYGGPTLSQIASTILTNPAQPILTNSGGQVTTSNPATGGSAVTEATIWAYGARSLTDKVGFTATASNLPSDYLTSGEQTKLTSASTALQTGAGITLGTTDENNLVAAASQTTPTNQQNNVTTALTAQGYSSSLASGIGTSNSRIALALPSVAFAQSGGLLTVGTSTGQLNPNGSGSLTIAGVADPLTNALTTYTTPGTGGYALSKLGTPAGSSIASDIAVANAGIVTANTGIGTVNTGLTTANSGITAIGTGVTNANTGIGSANTSLSTANSNINGLSTGLATANSGITTANTGISQANTTLTALPASVAAAVQAIPVESTETLIQTLRILRAVLAGNSTVTGQTVTFKRKDGTTAAVTITNDSLGNRTGSTPGILAP